MAFPKHLGSPGAEYYCFKQTYQIFRTVDRIYCPYRWTQLLQVCTVFTHPTLMSKVADHKLRINESYETRTYSIIFHPLRQRKTTTMIKIRDRSMMKLLVTHVKIMVAQKPVARYTQDSTDALILPSNCLMWHTRRREPVNFTKITCSWVSNSLINSYVEHHG